MSQLPNVEPDCACGSDMRMKRIKRGHLTVDLYDTNLSWRFMPWIGKRGLVIDWWYNPIGKHFPLTVTTYAKS